MLGNLLGIQIKSGPYAQILGLHGPQSHRNYVHSFDSRSLKPAKSHTHTHTHAQC